MSINICIYVYISKRMIIDIIQSIIDYGQQLINKIRCMKINKYVYDNTYIFQIDKCYNYCYRYDQQVIKQKKFSKLRTFNCSNIYNIHNIYNLNHLADTLHNLYCDGEYCGIHQGCISELKKIKSFEL